jgi:predicted house-cleaning noncanonical NTP pyrophosphatase (MazG superfamily)
LKLVRDKIIGLMDNPKYHIAEDEEYIKSLGNKLIEEFDELKENPCEEEMADILEVVFAISDYYNFNRDLVVGAKNVKFKERGGFSGRIILEDWDENYDKKEEE